MNEHGDRLHFGDLTFELHTKDEADTPCRVGISVWGKERPEKIGNTTEDLMPHIDSIEFETADALQAAWDTLKVLSHLEGQ